MVSNEEKITVVAVSSADHGSSASSGHSINASSNSVSQPNHQHQSRSSPRVSPRVSPGAPNMVPLSPRQPNSNQSQNSSFSIDKTEEFVFTVPDEAPVFVPSAEEFKNPLTYINKIRPIAEKYGICKIRPPATWQPPFTVNVDKLRFTPRVQRLNELEAKTRVKLNFLDQIAKFWELQGSSLKIPMVERKALDLYSLHRLVQDEGGIDQTTNGRKWSNISSRMGYPSGKSIGTILKGHYERILYPFDLFTLGEPGEKMKAKLETESGVADHDYKPHGIVSRQKVLPPREPTARRSQRIDAAAASEACSSDERKIKDEHDATDSIVAARAAELRRKFYGVKSFSGGPKSRMNGGSAGSTSASGGGTAGGSNSSKRSSQRKHNLDPLAKYICHMCNRGDVEEAMLLCDGCDDSYHTFCLMPPLEQVPKGEWRCPKCVVEEVSKPTEAFGFEQAKREYTLQQFGEMADQFKTEYFNIPVHLVPTQMVEREFWRIVSSIDEDVVVEYGADLHTMDHGSGFPTKSSLYLLPGDQEYAESSWNLNNLPLLEESILGHINADISGMKVPWMYVGMCFAAFCWHNEDHWSYSINYLHWGEPKTWYGVPGSSAEAFETTMKRAAPELFQSQPDLLHQLVTIMNPNILMTDGVPVYRTDQHAGEFIITFPRAYHAGFNQGYNFAEAVNFAPADWMKIGRECINHYSTLRRFCVFSHDELVCKMALDPDKLNLGIATACYLDMAEMVDNEKKQRKSLLEWGVTRAEREAFELIPDDERQCEVCKTTCFLSAVTCSCMKALVCLRHYSEMCKCTADKRTLKYRYTLDELPLMLRKLKVKAESFENWLSRVRDVIDPNTPTVITLDELQELAQEAEDKKFPGSVLLERLNSAVLEAEKCVTVIQQLDINKMRTRTRNSCEFAKYKLTLEELDLFVQEIDNLCCIIPEGNSVRELQQMGIDFVEQCQALLKNELFDVDVDDVRKMMEEGSSLCIELPQLKQLKHLHEQLHWYNDVREVRESGDKIPLMTMKRLLEQGLLLAPQAIVEKELGELQSIMIAVDMWEASAAHCFQSNTQHELSEVEQLLAQAEQIDGNLPSQPALRDALRKAKDWLAIVDKLQNNENYPYLHTIEAVIKRGGNIAFQLTEMRRMEDHVVTALEWKQRVRRTFLRRDGHFTILDALSPRPEAVMLSDRYPQHLNEAQYMSLFAEDTGPVQVVIAFKNAEKKELRDMSALRSVNANKNPEIDTFCSCRRRFYGNMLRCQLCLDWFHDGCVAAQKRSARVAPLSVGTDSVPQMTQRERDRELKFMCSSCMRSRRPRLESILLLLMSLQRLPIRLPEGEALQCLTERAMNWQDRARQALSTPEVVGKLATLSEIGHNQQSSSGEDVDKTQRTVACSLRTSQSSDISDDAENGLLSAVKAGDDKLNRSNESALSADNDNGLISLNESTQVLLNDLLMEGDLLEVCLDETQIIWRILNATKPSQSDFTLIKLQYNIMLCPYDPHDPPETENTALTEDDKSLSTSNQNTADKSCVTALCRKSGKHTNITSGPVNSSDLTSSLSSQQNNYGGGGSNIGESAILNATGNSKLKRGRKLKIPDMKMSPSAPMSSLITTKTLTTSAEDLATHVNSLATAVLTSVPVGVVKKKRGRKSIPDNLNQTPTTASTSDEEEECSAPNCVRPAGREVDWVQCDGYCQKWYHMYCVGLVKNQVKSDEDYVCTKCQALKRKNAASSVSNSQNLSEISSSSPTTVSTCNTTNLASKFKQHHRVDEDTASNTDEKVERTTGRKSAALMPTTVSVQSTLLAPSASLKTKANSEAMPPSSNKKQKL